MNSTKGNKLFDAVTSKRQELPFDTCPKECEVQIKGTSLKLENCIPNIRRSPHSVSRP